MPSSKIKQTEIQKLVTEFKYTKNLKLIPIILDLYKEHKELLWYYFTNFDKINTKKYENGYRIYMSFNRKVKKMKAPLHFNLDNIKNFCDKDDFIQFIDFSIIRCIKRYIMHTQFEHYVNSVLEYRTANFLVKCLRQSSPDIYHKGLYYTEEYIEPTQLEIKNVNDYLIFISNLQDFNIPLKINKYLPINKKIMNMFRNKIKFKKQVFDYSLYANLLLHKVL